MKLLDGEVKSEWVDYNGHMGDYAYAIVFSDAVTAFMDHIGVDEAYRTTKRCTIYTLEMRISYLLECHKGQRFHVVQQIIDADQKRVHVFHRMVDDATGEDLAWCEQMLMHMQQHEDAPPKSSVFPADIQQVVDELAALDKDKAKPDWVGKPMGIRRKA